MVHGGWFALLQQQHTIFFVKIYHPISGGAMIFVWGMPNQNVHMQTGKMHLAIW
jgi:hypothetical protein